MPSFIIKYKHWFFSILSGLLLALPWLSQSLGSAIFIAFIPLLYNIYNAQFSFFKTGILVWISCFIWFSLSTRWLYSLHFSTSDFLLLIPFLLLYSFILSSPFLFANYLLKKYSSPISICVLVVSWAMMECANSNWDLSNTWVNLHYALCDFPYLLGFIRYTGFRFASPYILLVNIAIFLFFFNTQPLEGFRQKFIWVFWSITLLFILLDVVVQLQKNTWKHQAKISVVQPNFDPYQVVDAAAAKERFNHLLNLTHQLGKENLQLICWPETALRGSQIDVAALANDTTIIALKKLSKQIKSPILLGTFLFKIYDYKPSNFTAAPTGDGRFYDVTNSAMLVMPSGGVDIYHKIKMVPFIERLPFIKYLSGNSSPLFQLGEQFPSYERGKKNNLLETPDISIVPVICNESVYPDHVKKFALQNADVIIILSNDGWAGNSSLASLHAAYAKILAIENNKYVVRATNNGVSMVISPQGIVEASTKYGASSVMTATIKF